MPKRYFEFKNNNHYFLTGNLRRTSNLEEDKKSNPI